MSHPRQGSNSKDTHWWIGEQDEETGSHNDQDDEFSKRDSLLIHSSGVNRNQQQQPQLTQVPDSHSKESYQSSSRSQGNRTSVTSSQGYPPNDDSPMNQQQSSTKISTSEECTSSNDSLPNSQNIRHSPQQQFSARPTFPREQPQKELLPSDRVHAPPKDDYPQSHSQSSSDSKQQSSPISTASLKNKPQITYQSHQQPSLVTASSPSPKRCLSKDDHLASSQNSKHLKQQQPSDYSTYEPHKQVKHPKHSTAPQAELAKTSPVLQEPEDDHEPQKSQSTSIKDPSAQRHAAAPPKSEEQNVNHKNVGPQKVNSTSSVEASPKNVRPLRTQNKGESNCSCCIL